MTCKGCFDLDPDAYCVECFEVARENYLRAARMVEVVEKDPAIFGSETRASVEMMRWIIRYFKAREARDERAKGHLAEIDDLRNGVEAGKRAAKMVQEYCQAMRDIEEVLDLRRAPDAYPGKVGIPNRVEALIDAWGDALTALEDLLKNPNSTEAKDQANAALVAGGFGVKRY
jgi:hypothetical protein